MANKKRCYLFMSLGLSLLFPYLINAQSDTPFVSLFNGTDLAGWSLKSAATDIKNFATVKNGYIDLESPGGGGWLWLYSDKEYTDFILKLKFTAPSGEQGNSGINFRSLWDPNDQGGYLNGPQVDIYTNSNWRTGLILDMTKGNERWLFPNLPDWNVTKQTTPTGWKFYYNPDWNDLEVRVIGMKVTTIVNGITYANNWNGDGIINDQLHKNKKVGEKGYLALQAHSDQKVVIYFKDISIADLTAVGNKSASFKKPRGGIGDPDIHDESVEVFSINGMKTELMRSYRRNNPKPGVYILKKGGICQLKTVVR